MRKPYIKEFRNYKRICEFKNQIKRRITNG